MQAQTKNHYTRPKVPGKKPTTAIIAHLAEVLSIGPSEESMFSAQAAFRSLEDNLGNCVMVTHMLEVLSIGATSGKLMMY